MDFWIMRYSLPPAHRTWTSVSRWILITIVNEYWSNWLLWWHISILDCIFTISICYLLWPIASPARILCSRVTMCLISTCQAVLFLCIVHESAVRQPLICVIFLLINWRRIISIIVLVYCVSFCHESYYHSSVSTSDFGKKSPTHC